WGLYDEDLFRYLLKSLQEASEPQFILAMTTTNHPPYQLPASYSRPALQIPAELQKRLIVDSALSAQRFATYRYSTDKLAEFLHQVKNSPLKDRLIIAVTGDHTFWIVNFSEQELLQKGSVPLYLYMPPAIRKKLDPESFGSQADIAPTLYNLALSNQEYDSLGRDLFSATGDFAINASRLIVDRSGGVLTGKALQEDHFLNWQGDYERLIPGTENEHQKRLSVRYKSLMSILDYYFMIEKNQQKGPAHADSSR
ncbi:MAG: sulfatase-like hydrolase/transferase, partial [Bdellovibrio sp.]